MDETTPRTTVQDQRDPAATLGVPSSPKDPGELSARLAGDAVRRVHAVDGVPAGSPVDPHPDPVVPGANYVDVRDPGARGHEHGHEPGEAHPRYWVGLSGEVLPTAVAEPHPDHNPELRRARSRYTGAVEAVRLRDRVPVTTELFATPDSFVTGAFFVHEAPPDPVVRWVDPAGEVHDGYRVVDGEPRWEDTTVEARRSALRAQPATADLVT